MLYWVAKYVMWLCARLPYRISVTGAGHIPPDGAFIACANHIHAFDPVMIAVSIRRRLYFIGKKELFRRKPIALFLRGLGVFPVDRGAADMQAFKQAIEILKDGKGLLVFSQGTRMKEFTDSKNGTALFALKTGTPIVPIGITGRYTLFSRVRIRIGEPVSMAAHAGKRIKSGLLQEVMDEVVARVKELTL